MPRKGEKLSLEQREKWSRVQIERHQRVRRQYVAEPDHKKCSGCGETKPIGNFSLRQRKLKDGGVSVHPDPRCKECNVEQTRRWRQRKKEEGTYHALRAKYAQRERERRRKRERERRAARRVEAGLPPRGWKKYRVDPSAPRGKGLPTAPLRALLEKELEDRGPKTLAAATGLGERRINGILREETPTITLGTVDAILTGLGCPEELHVLYPSEPERVGYRYLDAEGALEPKGTGP